MDATTREPIEFSSQDLAILGELLEAERTRVLVEIRHTDRRAYREELRARLNSLEQLIQQIGMHQHNG